MAQCRGVAGVTTNNSNVIRLTVVCATKDVEKRSPRHLNFQRRTTLFGIGLLLVLWVVRWEAHWSKHQNNHVFFDTAPQPASDLVPRVSHVLTDAVRDQETHAQILCGHINLRAPVTKAVAVSTAIIYIIAEMNKLHRAMMLDTTKIFDQAQFYRIFVCNLTFATTGELVMGLAALTPLMRRFEREVREN